jgi:hypothetical protein
LPLRERESALLLSLSPHALQLLRVHVVVEPLRLVLHFPELPLRPAPFTEPPTLPEGLKRDENL